MYTVIPIDLIWSLGRLASWVSPGTSRHTLLSGWYCVYVQNLTFRFARVTKRRCFQAERGPPRSSFLGFVVGLFFGALVIQSRICNRWKDSQLFFGALRMTIWECAVAKERSGIIRRTGVNSVPSGSVIVWMIFVLVIFLDFCRSQRTIRYEMIRRLALMTSFRQGTFVAFGGNVIREFSAIVASAIRSINQAIRMKSRDGILPHMISYTTSRN